MLVAASHTSNVKLVLVVIVVVDVVVDDDDDDDLVDCMWFDG